MNLKPLHVADALVLLALTALAWAIAGWFLGVPVFAVGVLLMWRARKAPVESEAEAADGRRRTYAQFQKDLHDPTGAAGIALLRDVD